MLYPAPDSFAVVQHLVNRDRESVLIAEHGLGKRIADKNDVDGNFIYQTRARVVVCSQAGDRLVSKFLFFKGSDSNFLARFANWGETHDVLQCPSAAADRACKQPIRCCYGIVVANQPPVDSLRLLLAYHNRKVRGS